TRRLELALKRTSLMAGIFIGRRVCGLNPLRADRWATANVPNPTRCTWASLLSPFLMAPSTESAARSAAALEVPSPSCLCTSLTSSALFMGFGFLGKGLEWARSNAIPPARDPDRGRTAPLEAEGFAGGRRRRGDEREADEAAAAGAPDRRAQLARARLAPPEDGGHPRGVAGPADAHEGAAHRAPRLDARH